MTSSGAGAEIDWTVLSDLPHHGLEGSELDDLELTLVGALAGPSDFSLPDEARAAAAGAGLLLTDPQGTPLALLQPTGLTALRPAAHGVGRAWRHRPFDVAAQGVSAAVAFREVPTRADLAAAGHLASTGGSGRLLLVALVGHGTPKDVLPVDLVRAVVAAADTLVGAEPLVVPLTRPSEDPTAWADRLTSALAAYGVTTVVDATAVRTEQDAEQLSAIVGGQADIEGLLPETSLAALRRSHPAGTSRGAVVLLSGLSGSGKSTIARALADRIEDAGERRVTLLDGDEVRRLLSSGLGFDRESRELNVRRIGYVAALVAEHGGLALCAPIAPFEAARADMRARAEAVGEFVLVHVATPLEVCEARDRKGLYAKARAGVVPEFTGISSPYETPTDADVVVDTTDALVDEAVDAIWAELVRRDLVT
ncbi:MAG TPA: adenylyl-sulfate kinase [Candidatus Limnocylindria bacterium]|nr:adenylyl-sulfate kinase [Candidatus Limnocylindria bacterium]